MGLWSFLPHDEVIPTELLYLDYLSIVEIWVIFNHSSLLPCDPSLQVEYVFISVAHRNPQAMLLKKKKGSNMPWRKVMNVNALTANCPWKGLAYNYYYKKWTGISLEKVYCTRAGYPHPKWASFSNFVRA